MAKTHKLKFEMTGIPIDSDKLNECKPNEGGVEIKKRKFYKRGSANTTLVKSATIEVTAKGEDDEAAEHSAQVKLKNFVDKARNKKVDAGRLRGLS